MREKHHYLSGHEGKIQIIKKINIDFIDLKGKLTERGNNRKEKAISQPLVQSPDAALTGARPAKSLGLHPPCVWQRNSYGAISAAFPGVFIGNLIQRRAAGMKSGPVQDAGRSRDLTCCITTLASLYETLQICLLK